MKNIVIVGYGQLGATVCQRHLTINHRVTTISRQPHASLGSLHSHINLDLDLMESPLSLVHPIDCLYYFAPPSDQTVCDDRILRFLRLHDDLPIHHIIYISTSGVYGDSGGQWITEDTPTAPKADRAKRRLDAEQQLTQWQQQHSTALTVLRCAAIYSEKTINEQRICNNTKPVINANQAPYTNRISLHDLTNVCLAAMQQPASKVSIYNVSDGQPSTTTEHAWLLSDTAGCPRSAEVSIEKADEYYSEAYMSYLNESKRLDITKLKKAFNLNFKTTRQGIIDCLNDKI